MQNYEIIKPKEQWVEGPHIEKFYNLVKPFLKDGVRLVFNGTHQNVLKLEHQIKKENVLGLYNWIGKTKNPKAREHQEKIKQQLNICADSCFAPLIGDNYIQYEFNGIPIASYCKISNNIYFLWDVAHQMPTRTNEEGIGEGDGWNLMYWAIEYFSSVLENDDVLVHTPIKESKPMMVPKNCSIEQRKKEFIEKENAHRQRVMDLTRQLTEANLNLVSIQHQISSLKNRSEEMVPVQNLKVISITNSEDSFVIRTKPLFIEKMDWLDFFDAARDSIEENDENEEDYEFFKHESEILSNPNKYKIFIGQFDISVNMINGSIRFDNITEKRRGYWSNSGHPHIDGDGEACMGNLSEMIAFATSNEEIPLLVDLLIQFVESVNLQDSAGRSVYRWDIIKFNEDGTMYNLNRGEVFHMIEEKTLNKVWQ